MAGPNTLAFTDANFEQEVLQSSVPVLVDFWAEWCMPCRMLSPVIDKIANNYAGRAKVGKVNTDEARQVAIKYGIQSIPTVMLFKGGKLVNTVVGPNEKTLVAMIEDALK